MVQSIMVYAAFVFSSCFLITSLLSRYLGEMDKWMERNGYELGEEAIWPWMAGWVGALDCTALHDTVLDIGVPFFPFSFRVLLSRWRDKSCRIF